MKTTFRILPAAWPLVIFLLLPALTRGETAVQAWVQLCNGSPDYAYLGLRPSCIAVDGSNNIIVAGTGEGYHYSIGVFYDYVTIKYSSAGLPLWTNIHSRGYEVWDETEDRAYAVAVEGSNNVIVTGYSGGSYGTIKYSSAGVGLWTNYYSGPLGDGCWARAVAVDGANNVIVTGYSYGSGTFFDYATIKYSSDGAPLWTNRYTWLVNVGDYAYAVAVDGSNNVIVTGNPATIKYSSDGLPLWTNLIWGEATAVAVDASNNVIVTGLSTESGAAEYATIKYSSAGAPLWTNRCGDGSGYAVAVDGSNNVIVTGFSRAAGRDYATIKYSSAGVPLWTNRYSGPWNSDDEAWAVAVDGRNNVIVTGGELDSDTAVTIKYSAAGVPLWTNAYAGAYAWDGAVDSSGNVIVTGESIGGFTTIKYICVREPVLTGLKLTNGTFELRVDEVLQPGTLVIEAATNLAGWAPVFTNTTPTNAVFYTDPEASNYLRRFYRAYQFP